MYEPTGRTKKTWMTDLTGRRFGQLTVIRFMERRKSRYLWECRCDCGNVTIVSGDKLRDTRRPTRSCGCLTVESTRLRSTTHGHLVGRRMSPEYQTWRGMIERCTNPKAKHWSSYGGRGITVCLEWRDFQTFLADMGERPSKAHTIDRKDNNGNYEPSNCRWATDAEQRANRNNSVRVDVEGRSMTIADASAQTGIPEQTIYSRAKILNWPATDVTSPVKAGMSDISGLRVGRLSVLRFSHRDGKRYYWACRCDCGGEKNIERHRLTGKTPSQSCGCLQREAAVNRWRKFRGE